MISIHMGRVKEKENSLGIAKRSLKRKFGHTDITEQIKLANNIITNDLQITKSIKNAMNRLKT